MANGSVVVHDIESLEKFGMELAARSAELESLYNALTVSCAAQETNWHDPQYDLLHERVELYAGEARAQLLALNDAVQYISVLAATPCHGNRYSIPDCPADCKKIFVRKP